MATFFVSEAPTTYSSKRGLGLHSVSVCVCVCVLPEQNIFCTHTHTEREREHLKPTWAAPRVTLILMDARKIKSV